MTVAQQNMLQLQ